MAVITVPAADSMRSPLHPGKVLRDAYLKPLNLRITRVARALGISRKHLSAIVNGRARIKARSAVRLELACGGSAEFWLRLQNQFDLARAAKKPRPKVTSLNAAGANRLADIQVGRER